MTDTVPLECQGCGKIWDHPLHGCEPEGTVRMESDICAACNDPAAPRNAIASYFDEDDELIESSEFTGANHRHDCNKV